MQPGSPPSQPFSASPGGMNPPSKLDSTAFPHIFERVRAHAPYELLLRLRLVNRASRDVADAILFDHVAFSHNEGVSETLVCAGMAFPIIAHSLSSSCVDSKGKGPCRLPLPPLIRGFGLTKLPSHDGWKHTRVLDFEAGLPMLNVAGPQQNEGVPELPALQTVRRRVQVSVLPHVHSLVDVLRLPPPIDKTDSHVNVLFHGTQRHVILVLYDPACKGLAHDYRTDVPFWDAGTHCIMVFRACPSRLEGENAATRASDGSPSTGSVGITFLNYFFFLVAERTHDSYTLVGLEDIPPPLLAIELGLDADDLALAPRLGSEGVGHSTDNADTWAQLVQDRVVQTISSFPSDTEELFGDTPGFRKIEDMVEVLTMDQYRARVGEDVWRLETFGDVLPPPLMERSGT